MNVWIVRWRKCGRSSYVYNTQATNFRVFDTMKAAESFRAELRRRIKLRYEADYGEPQGMYGYSTCGCGELNDPGAYSVTTENEVTVEIICAEMNDATLHENELEVS